MEEADELSDHEVMNTYNDFSPAQVLSSVAFVLLALFATSCGLTGGGDEISVPPTSTIAQPDSNVSSSTVDDEQAEVALPPTTATTTTSVEGDEELPEEGEETPILTPADVAGSSVNAFTDLGVLTSVGDDLNVRKGPGTGYEIVETLPHQTMRVNATHEVTLESGAVWRYIEREGSALGWVHGGFLAPASSTGFCIPGADFPEFEGAVSVAKGDVDLDGLEDEVFILAEPMSAGGYDAWAIVTFGNGGVATGNFGGHFEPGTAAGIELINLNTGTNPDETLEVVFLTAQGPAIGAWGVMRFDDCSLVTTTMNGSPFEFSVGVSIGTVAGAGCAYGTGGKIEFNTTISYPQMEQWETTVFQLVGNEWTELERFDHTVFPGLTSPEIPSLTDC